MADEAETNDGSIESAVAQLHEARTEAAKPEPKIKPEAPEPAAPVATVETEEPPPGQQETGEADVVEADTSDADQESNIDAPAWFTPEEKELFKALPPEQQGPFLRLAKGAQGSISRLSNEQQAAIREAQAARDAAAQERQYFASVLQQYRNPLVADYQREFADVLSGQTDVLRLSQDPQRWPRYQGYQSRFNQIAQHEQILARQAEEDENARLQQHIETRNSQLIEAKPELKDPAKFEQYDAEVSNYLRGLKIPDDRIARVSFEELTIIEKAMKWDRAQKAKASAPKPAPTPDGRVAVQGHLRTVPKVLKPGMGSNAGAADDKMTAIDQRARQSGSVDDAAARIRIRLGKRA